MPAYPQPPMKASSNNLINLPELLDIGGNSSFYDGVIILDNLDESETEPASQNPFGNRPLKLNFDVVLICVSGGLGFNIDCRESLSLREGEIAVFTRGQIAEFKNALPDTRLMIIASSPELKTSVEYIADTCARYGIMSHIPSREYAETVADIYRLMKKLIDGEDTKYKSRILSDYLDIMYLTINESFLRHTSGLSVDASSHRANRQTEIYHAFVSLVKRQFVKHRDVEYYADALCLSAGHLSRIVKNRSGKTVGEWIKDYIILEAKVLLKSTPDAIYQISDALHFPNPSFFCKYFKEKTGMTPNQYRNSGT